MTTLRAFIERNNTHFLRNTVDKIIPDLHNYGVRLQTAWYPVDEQFHNINYDGTYYYLTLPEGVGRRDYTTIIIELARIVQHQETCDPRDKLLLYPKNDASFLASLRLAREWMMEEERLKDSLRRHHGLLNLVASDFGVHSKMVEARMQDLNMTANNHNNTNSSPSS